MDEDTTILFIHVWRIWCCVSSLRLGQALKRQLTWLLNINHIKQVF